MPSEQVQTELWRSGGKGGVAEPAVREDALGALPEAFSTLYSMTICSEAESGMWRNRCSWLSTLSQEDL